MQGCKDYVSCFKVKARGTIMKKLNLIIWGEMRGYIRRKNSQVPS